MASVHKDPSGWRIDARLPSGARTVIRLGPGSSKRLHDEVAAKLRSLIVSRGSGTSLEPATAAWLTRCGDRLHRRLVALGLAPARERDRPLLDWMDVFFTKHAEHVGASEGTRKVWLRARSHAERYFHDRLLSTITESDAADFRAWLLALPGRATDVLAEATVRKTCSVVSQACKAAVKAGALSANPFEDVPTSVGTNAARECYVDAATVRRVMDAAASDELRLLIAISRFAGLRVPSEIRTLRWGSINWEHHSLRVDSPKTAKQGKPWRLVPLVPELFALMERAYDAAPEGAEFILPTFRLHSNSGMAVLRAIRAAGVQPWPRTFHAMRASCETDLASKHPLADVAAWLGHTRTVAARHYLRPTEASFAAVTGRTGGDCGEIRGDARGDNSADFVVTPVVTLSAALARLAPPDATQVPSPPQLIAIQRLLERAGADLCELPENLASGPDRSRTAYVQPMA